MRVFNKLEMNLTEAVVSEGVVAAKLVVVSIDDNGNRYWVKDLMVEIPIPEGYPAPAYVVTANRRVNVCMKEKLLTIDEARKLFLVEPKKED